MERKVFLIENLHCSKCALELQNKFLLNKSVINCEVSFMKQKIILDLNEGYNLKELEETILDFDCDILILGIEETFSCNLKGLDDHDLVYKLKKQLSDIKGISGVNIVYALKKLTLTYFKKDALGKAIDYINSLEGLEVLLDIKKKTLELVGLDCAGCASELAEIIRNIPGVISSNVVFVTQKLFLEYTDDLALPLVIDACNHFEDVKVKTSDEVKEKKDYSLVLIIISAIFFLITFILGFIFKGKTQDIIFYVGYGISYLVVGYPVLVKTFKSILAKRFFDENFLMTFASIGAILISIFSDDNMMMEAGAVMLLYQTGEYLQAKAVNSSRKTIKGLLELKSDVAHKLEGNLVRDLKPEELRVNDIILIKAGEKIPTDAVVLEGEGEIDTKSLTGEALPKFVKADDEILSGCFNLNAPLKAKVLKPFNESTVAKILDLIENSAANKAKPEKFITKFARIYTPLVCLISFLIIILGVFISYFVTGNWSNTTDWVIRGLSVLVISCPCALIISVPLTYFGGIGACASKGILVKSASKLDDLTKVETAIFDKTGTLTLGKFKIVNLKSTDEALMKEVASSLEASSNHPISEAFKVYNIKEDAYEVKELVGYGMVGLVRGKKGIIGNAKLLKEEQIEFSEVKSLHSLLYVAYDNKYLGYFEIDDTPKEELETFINKLNKFKINESIILSGDNELRVNDFKNKYHLTKAYGGLLPFQKLKIAKDLEQEKPTLYVGDGINDAPVMSVVSCSFSMGKLGSDTAVEASDFVLVEDNLLNVLEAKAIALKTKHLVYQNIIFSIAIKVIVMIVGAFGLVPLWLAVFSDVGVMLLAVLNSLRIRLKIKI